MQITWLNYEITLTNRIKDDSKLHLRGAAPLSTRQNRSFPRHSRVLCLEYTSENLIFRSRFQLNIRWQYNVRFKFGTFRHLLYPGWKSCAPAMNKNFGTFFLNRRPSRLKIRWRLRFLYRFEGDWVIDLSEVHGNILYNASNLLITQQLQNVYSSALLKIFTSNLYRTVYRSANGSSYTSLSK
jgi:hypothetical protein